MGTLARHPALAGNAESVGWALSVICSRARVPKLRLISVNDCGRDIARLQVAGPESDI